MPVNLRQRERCLRYHPGRLVTGITFLILTGGISAGPAMFKLVYHERRGTSVLKVVNVPLPTCSILCHQDKVCQGFNFLQSSGVCELLRKPRYASTPDSTSQMYLKKHTWTRFRSKSKCNTCEGDSWPIPGTVNKWGVNCKNLGYVRGIIAVNSPPTFSFDYLMCLENSFMLPDPESYGVVLPGGVSGDCVSTVGGPAALTAFWTNDISFDNQTNNAVLCQSLISGCKVDKTDCAPSKRKNGIIVVKNQEVSSNFIECPDDMLAVNIYRTYEGEWTLKCCRFYHIS